MAKGSEITAGKENVVLVIVLEHDIYTLFGHILPLIALCGEFNKLWVGNNSRIGNEIASVAKNGYVSYKFTYDEDNQHSIIEFCYRNCSDGQHKLLGQNQKFFVNGEYIQTELTVKYEKKLVIHAI